MFLLLLLIPLINAQEQLSKCKDMMPPNYDPIEAPSNPTDVTVEHSMYGSLDVNLREQVSNLIIAGYLERAPRIYLPSLLLFLFVFTLLFPFPL